KLGKLPVIGPLFRIVRSVTRLPVMMRDQQRFESYAIAQQQRLEDFVNEHLTAAVPPQRSDAVGEVQATVADVVDTVMMLSDSVVELEAHLKQISDGSAHISTQLTTLEEAQRELQSQAELLAREPPQLQAQIASLIEQREKS